MRRDSTEFRQRFKDWKEGKQVYENGRPVNQHKSTQEQGGVMPPFTPSYEKDEGYVNYMKKLSSVMSHNWKISQKDAYNEMMYNTPGYNYKDWYHSEGKYINPQAFLTGVPYKSNQGGHFPDTYKTPWHKTFSNQSKYSGKVSNVNPFGFIGGTWAGETFIPGPSGLRGYEGGKDTYNAGFLPEVQITAKRTNKAGSVGYWDSLGKQWMSYDNYGNRTSYGEGYKPDYVVKTPIQYENLRQAQWRKADPNHVGQFVDWVKGVAEGAVTTRAGDIAGELVGNAVNKFIAKPAINFIKKNKIFIKRTPNLDWTPESWFGTRSSGYYDADDVAILQSHIPEYLEIEKTSKANGTWLKMPNGSTWKGDPRSWVQLMSKRAKNFSKDVYYHGDSNIYIDSNGADITGQIFGKKLLWGNTNPLVADTYGTQIYPLIVPKHINTININAKGYNWNALKGAGLPFKDTNEASYALLKDNGALKIQNVVDYGPLWMKETINRAVKLANKNESVDNAVSRIMLGDDLVINSSTLRKSILGNNGNFDLYNPNIYKSIAIGSTITPLYKKYRQ